MKINKPRPKTTSSGCLWAIILVGGIAATIFFYLADIFWQDEGFTAFAVLILSLAAWRHTSTLSLHRLYLRENAAIGAARLGVLLALAWCAYVFFVHADPTLSFAHPDNYPQTSVLFILMAWVATKVFGQSFAQRFGPNLRVDVYERKNLAAGTFIGAFALGAGMIYGGAMWGEFDPRVLEYHDLAKALLPSEAYAIESGKIEEAGWWVTPWFFLLGWLAYVLSVAIWFWSERGSFRDRIVRDRSSGDARAAAYFCIAVAIICTYAVAGDYHGFLESMIGFAFVAVPVIGHGIMRPGTDSKRGRDLEGLTYVGLAVVTVLMLPWFAGLFGLEL